MSFGIAAAAFGVVSAIDQGRTAGIQAASTKKGIEAQQQVAKLQTEKANAESGTARALQTINNNRALRVGGKQFDAASQNRARNADAYTRGTIEQQIQHSEAQGAYAANVASKGVGGASADAIQLTLALQQSRQTQAAKQSNEYLTYDQAKQQAGIMPTTMNSLDMTVYSGGVDNTVVMPKVTGGTDYAGMGAAFLNSNLAKAIPDLYAKFTSQPSHVMSGQGLSSNAAPASMYSFGTGGVSAGLSGIKLR